MHGQGPRYRRKCAPASLVVARRGREVDHAEGVLEDWTVHSAFGGAIACNSPGAERIALTAPEGLSSHEAFARSLLRIDQLPASPQTPTNLPRSQ